MKEVLIMISRPIFFRQRWFQIFTGGLLLFIAIEEAFRITGNPNYFPTVILLGALLVPVSFVAYVWDKIPAKEISLSCLLTCFLGGGVVGLIAAGLIEYQTIQKMGIPMLLMVGLVEEGAKLIFPMVQYVRGKYHTEADGLLFGVASGMGFAALETMGYGMVAFLQSGGSITALEETLLIRGLLSPAGHAAWTGFVCAVIWREQERNRHGLSFLLIISSFILAIVLHTLWDMVNSIGSNINHGLIIVIAGNVVIAGVSLWLLIWRMRDAIRYDTPTAPEPTP
jgi:RsiW-degrading membrane proteinase PrsW (M82 family)